MIALLFMATASASPAGSSTNQIITKVHLDNVFAPALRAEIAQTLGSAADKALSRLDEIHKNYIGYSFTPSFKQISLAAGDSMSLLSGGSFILSSGSATLNIVTGTVINLSTGSEVASGAKLSLNQRYFCVENTTANIMPSTAVTGLVDGYYLSDGAVHVATGLPFTDVTAGAWFYAAVEFAYENDLFKGTTATTFSPNTSMTRAMFVTVLHRLDGLPAAGSGSGFSDVRDSSQYYYSAVIWASGNDIVNGYTDGTFQPNRNVTREQMAAIMYRYAEYKKRDLSTSGNVFETFPDKSDVSGYAEQPMRWAVSWEVIRGSNGKLLAQNTATRAEVAQIIYNYCGKIGR